MPLYEYICEQDGTVLELMRPMAQADAPVDDPAAKGRVFTRKLSMFSAGGSGWGGADKRDPAAVDYDLRNGYITKRPGRNEGEPS